MSLHPVFAGILADHQSSALRFATPASPSAHASLQAIADGIKARHAAKAAQQAPQPAPEPKTREQMQSELQAELLDFDPAYAYSDDHGFWSAQAAKASRINDLRRRLATAEAA